MVLLIFARMEMYRYFLHLAYDGTAYHGWQVQPNATTIQQIIEDSLSLLLREKIQVTGAGRTDTGVHARNYYAHFDTSLFYEEEGLEQLVYRINRISPKDIVVFSAFRVIDDAHARFSALSRTYKYYISRGKNPFYNLYSLQFTGNLDINLMNQAAAKLMTYRDFSCFSKSGTDTSTNICSISESCFIEQDNLLIYHVKANRFLRNMVRAIMGTLLEIGKGKLDLIEMDQILKSGNRSEAGESVPAKGLFLEDVSYPPDIRLLRS